MDEKEEGKKKGRDKWQEGGIGNGEKKEGRKEEKEGEKKGQKGWNERKREMKGREEK